MSASDAGAGGASVAALAAAFQEELPLTQDQAELLAEAIGPVRDVTDTASSFGSVLKNSDSPGPQLVGSVLEAGAIQVEMVASTAEVVARSIEVLAASEAQSLRTLFPPPQQLAADRRREFLDILDQLEQTR
jgi:hypothetical protein